MRYRGRRLGGGQPSRRIKLVDFDKWKGMRGDYTDTEMSIPWYKP